MSKIIAILLIFLSLVSLFPLLKRDLVDYGQLGKQTFAAEMIKSTKNGEVENGVFPIRHFLEPNHNDLIPWAEEFPIYSFGAAKLSALTDISIEHSAKFLSFISFLFLIYGFYALSESWIFTIVAAIFPAFRLYSVEIMPDLAMTAFCMWAVVWAKKDRPVLSAFSICLASLLKYYAVFTGFGLGLYYLIRLTKTKDKKNLLACVSLALAIVPCLAYIAYFIHLQIPNPITEYRATDGHGHLASLSGLLSFKKWVRIGTWLWIKNSSILGSLLAAYGFILFWKKRLIEKDLFLFYSCLMVGWASFSVLFIESFYVHDYYGLQASIGTAIFACFGLEAIEKRSKKIALGISVVFLIWSFIHVRGMARPITIVEMMKSKYEEINFDEKPHYVMSISGISKPLAIYNLNLKGWVSATDEYFTKPAQDRMKDTRIDGVMVLDFKEDTELQKVISDVNSKGFRNIKLFLETEKEKFYWFSK